MGLSNDYTLVLHRITSNLHIVAVYFIIYKAMEYLLHNLGKNFDLVQTIYMHITLYALLSIINVVLEKSI